MGSEGVTKTDQTGQNTNPGQEPSQNPNPFEDEINDLLNPATEEANPISPFFQGAVSSDPGSDASAGDATAVDGGGASEADEGGEDTKGAGDGDGGGSDVELEGGGADGAVRGAEGAPGASEGAEGSGASGEGDQSTEGTGEGDSKSAEGEGEKAQAGADSPEVEALKQQVAALTHLVEQLSTGKATAEPATSEAPTQPAEPPSNLDLTEAFKDVDIDDILESKEKFLDFFTKAAGMVYQQGQQDFMSKIPSTVTDNVRRTLTLQQTVDQFYQNNPELVPVKGYVASVAQGIAAEKPDLEVSQLLEEAAKKAKEALKIPEVPSTPPPADSSTASATGKKRPALPGGTKGAKTPQKQTTTEQDEILDLISD